MDGPLYRNNNLNKNVWEGVDICEEHGCNCLAKLAIHILSMIANSAGCEHAFSHMGLVWCQSLSHCYFCAKIIRNQERIPKLFPLGKMLLSMGWTEPQEELTSNSKLSEKIPVSGSNFAWCYIPCQELRGTPQEVKYWTPSDLPTNISLFHLLYYLI